MTQEKERPDWRERLKLHSGALPTVDLEIEKTALLLVDMQNYSANPDSDKGRLKRTKYPSAEIEEYYEIVRDEVIPNQLRLLEFWRENQLRVVYLTAGSLLEDGSDMIPRRQRRDAADIGGSNGPTEHRHPGTSDYQIIDELRPEPGEIVIPKNSIGAFNSSAIDQILRNFGVTGLVIVGVVTEGCVETTARDAADRGYECILVEDGCASSFSKETHEESLLNFARNFGEVMPTQDVLARFAKAIREPALV